MLIWGILAHVHIYIKKHNSFILSISKHGVKIIDNPRGNIFHNIFLEDFFCARSQLKALPSYLILLFHNNVLFHMKDEKIKTREEKPPDCYRASSRTSVRNQSPKHKALWHQIALTEAPYSSPLNDVGVWGTNHLHRRKPLYDWNIGPPYLQIPNCK